MDLSLITWNVRGLRRKEKKKAIRDLSRRYKTKMIFVQETKMETIQRREVKRLWGSDSFNYEFAAANGSAGGLLCIWDDSVFTVSDTVVKDRFVALIGVWQQSKVRCGFLNLYGPSVDNEKASFLAEVLAFLKSWQIPWCVGGDFNVFLSSEEKIGFTLNKSLLNLFNQFVNEAGLIDLPLVGGNSHGATIGIPLLT
ncbi:hypothetical protein HRI_005273800 [Hibiscus trionum]|uniref:Endonuclease/exonuclease/phosphatase domain-containing protein n=1 Tax=Hibiscus trionum TaxID=183268 RepID=A0A9W7MY19_HIBTR|nr:hypothetical protein HRI_005273800 [Hibiscus trionum]